jgi:hypothetical protein
VAGVRPVVPAENDATVPPVVASVPEVGNVSVVTPVVVNVALLAPENATVAAGMVSVPVVAVIAKPLTLVTVATPRLGVVSVGDEDSTTLPVPVEVVTPVPPEATASVPASVIAPVVAAVGVSPDKVVLNDATLPAVVARVPDVGSVTLVVPVVVIVVGNAPAKAIVDAGMVSVPVVAVIAKPLTLVTVATPRLGVVSVGDEDSTTLPVPVEVVTPVPPEATASVPPRVTVPVVAVAGVRPVVPAENDATVPPVVARVPEVGNVSVVTPVVVNVALLAPENATVAAGIVSVPVVVVTWRPFRLVAVATPSDGAVSVGLLDNTTDPVPVDVVTPVPPPATPSTPLELTLSAKIERLRVCVI